VTSGETLSAILRRAEAMNWAGADPYDGLASRLGTLINPLGQFPRFVLSQAVLRSPFIRGIANPPSKENPKGLALFLGAATQGRSILGDDRARSLFERLLSRITRQAVGSSRGHGWGYPFPWQSRSFWAPAGTPNTVVTATVGWHLIGAGEAFADSTALALGQSAAHFLRDEMHFTPAGEGGAISYTTGDRTRVVNLSALAARLFARVARARPQDDLLGLADQLTRFVLSTQREDGSWPYSMDGGGGWEDSFHTGFILEALLDLRRVGVSVPRETVSRGFAAYGRFFDSDGGARLFLKAESPLDAHSAAQGIVTYASRISDPEASPSESSSARAMAVRISDWARNALWLPAQGHFAYRITRGRRDERDYSRWVQAWMALGMAVAARLEVTDPAALDSREAVHVA
jgi:hypothetical protein